MEVFGADFSGGKSPNITYVRGELESGVLTITDAVPCDDRLDLYIAIVKTKAAWGLDFPFAVAQGTYDLLGLTGWEELLELAQSYDRLGFAAFLDERLPGFERKCSKVSVCCRYTDVQANSYSATKRFNPNLRGMIYGGFRFLTHLRQAGVSVYPFDEYSSDAARVYEIYPSYAWTQAGLTRSLNVEELVAAFNRLSLIEVRLPSNFSVQNQDAADSVAACMMMGTALHNLDMESHWDVQPETITDDEWRVRDREGLILRF